MKKIIFHAQSFNTFWAHYYVNKDPDFIDACASLGYELFQSDQLDLKEADYIVFGEVTSVGIHKFSFYHSLRYLAKLALGRASLNDRDFYSECIRNNYKIALCVAEGIVHMPQNHTRKPGKFFNTVLTWNDEMVDNITYFKYCIPQPVKWIDIEKVAFSDKKLLVNISGNKYEAHPDELYSVRRASIRYFEEHFRDQFELYGIGWNEPATLAQRIFKSTVPHYLSYKGMPKLKTDVFPKFKFAICYENHRWPGYITEKIFDCMRSDCVPIYLGAPNIDKYLPSGTYVDRSKFKSDSELADFLTKIDENVYGQYRSNIKEYLASSDFHQFECTAFAKTLISVLENNIR